MYIKFKEYLKDELNQLKEQGLYKTERIISTPQSARIKTTGGREVVNLCSNNYLGLSNHPALITAAKESYDKWGYGLSSVRFICGTQQIHKQLEETITDFLRTEDTILYSSCFDANGGLFETLLDENDAVISDSLNHASIIDGIRLCKAKRYRYANSDMVELENMLTATAKSRFRLIATDGVFSMDGYIAKLDKICQLAEKYDAMVMVDDSHSVGFMGEEGRGTHQYCNVLGKIDIITGTLGKALGGASGGYTSGRKEIIELLRNKSRPYLFSNTLAPAIVCASLKAFELIKKGELREKLNENTKYFRQQIKNTGLSISQGEHPIVPIILGDATLATKMAELLLKKGVYVVSFSYPVVPKGLERIRTQISANHNRQDLDFAIEKIAESKNELGI